MNVLLYVSVPPPEISVHPVDQIDIVPEGTAIFSVTATGEPLTYSWSKDGVGIVDTAGKYFGTDTDMLFVLDLVDPNDEGVYHVTVTNIANSAASNPAMLSVCKFLRDLLQATCSR